MTCLSCALNSSSVNSAVSHGVKQAPACAAAVLPDAAVAAVGGGGPLPLGSTSMETAAAAAAVSEWVRGQGAKWA
jgi:hypothetical protein